MQGRNFSKLFAATFIPFFLFTACSEDDPAGISPSSSDRFAQHISVNEKDSVITLFGLYTNKVCVYNDNRTVSWKPVLLDMTIDMPYHLDGDHLEMLFDSSSTIDLISKTHQSIYGTWYFNDEKADSSKYMEISVDSIISVNPSDSYTDTVEPVETALPLGSSYFLYDFFLCIGTELSCSFGHWHFEKNAEGLVLNWGRDLKVTYNEKKDRYIRLTVNDQEYTLEVQHAQVDSLNNGSARYEASIMSQSDTCRFEHINIKMVKELCEDSNVDDMSISTITNADGKDINFVEKIFRDNSEEFASCVKKMVGKAK